MRWKQEHFELLAELWTRRDLSMTGIAEVMSKTFGVPLTRSAISGMGSRRQLGPRPLTSTEGLIQQLNAKRVRRRGAPAAVVSPPIAPAVVPPPPKPVVPVEPVTTSAHPVPFPRDNLRVCVFPLWGWSEKTGMVCGDPIIAPSRSYCPVHSALCEPVPKERVRLR